MCIKETSPRDVSFTHQKHMFDRGKTDNTHMINLLYFNISAKGLFQEKTCTLVSTT